MKKYLLIDEFEGTPTIIDTIICLSKEEAEYYFSSEGWVIGEIVEEQDYLSELGLNSFESESYEG